MGIKGKDYSISFLRMTSMIFIVTCHFLQYYGNELAWWLNVGVQIFFFVSGFLYGHKEDVVSIDFIIKNFKKILIPYFCFLLPVIGLYAVFAKENLTLSLVRKTLLCASTIKGIGHLWFISYILFCYLITPYLYMICKKMENIGKTKPFLFIVVMLVILYFGHRLSRVYNSYFQFPRVCCYIVGYFMSYYLKDCSKKRMAWTSFVIFTMCILMNGIRIYYKYVLDSTFYRFDCFEAYAHDLLALSLFFVYRLLFANIRKNRLFQLSDRYSYHIYLVHQLFILSPFSLMAVTKVRVVNWIIVVAAILLSAILLKLVSDAVQCCYSKKKKVLPRCNSL